MGQRMSNTPLFSLLSCGAMLLSFVQPDEHRRLGLSVTIFRKHASLHCAAVFSSKSRARRIPPLIANAPLVRSRRNVMAGPRGMVRGMPGGGHGRGHVLPVQKPACDEGAGAFIAPRQPLGMAAGDGPPPPFCLAVLGRQRNVGNVPPGCGRQDLGGPHQKMNPAVPVGLQHLGCEVDPSGRTTDVGFLIGFPTVPFFQHPHATCCCCGCGHVGKA